MIHARDHLVLVIRLNGRRREVADARQRIPGSIRQGPDPLIRPHGVRDRIEQALRDDVAREWIARRRRRRRPVDAERIGNDNHLAGRSERLREIALQLGRGRNRRGQRLRLPLPEAFEIDKEEGLIAAVIDARYQDRPTHREPVLIEGQLRTLLPGAVQKEIVRIQFVVAQKFIEGPMQLIGSRLDSDIHDRARAPAEFGRIVVGLHAELLRRVDRGNEAGRIHQEHRDRRAIHQNLVGVRDTAVRGKISPAGETARGRILHKLTLGADAGRQRYQRQRIASVQRQFRHLAVLHHLAQGAGRGVEQRRLPGDFDRLALLADLQLRIQRNELLHGHFNRLLEEALESGVLELELVAPRRQRREGIGADVVTRLLPDIICIEVSQPQRCAGDHRPSRVGYDAADAASRSLREHQARENQPYTA